MPRYFLEVAYKGAAYSGFQSQKNANSIQQETGKAIETLFKEKVVLVCSSRTDAGVHALQNFFHFDCEFVIEKKYIYNLNAVLPHDIVVKNLYEVPADAHCRFDALQREYKYFIYSKKDPFLFDKAFYFPFKVDVELMQQAAGIVMQYKDFTSFSKRKTQVKTFDCIITKSVWLFEDDCLVYHVAANRFLRGMVKALVGTMLKAGRKIISPDEFKNILEGKDCRLADFSPPSKGLFLVGVKYEESLLQE